jgi:large conductance mechanosensitive channel
MSEHKTKKALNTVKQGAKGFGGFLTRGNAFDMAFGVVLGSAVSLFINSIVNDLIDPILAAITGVENFDQFLNFSFNGAFFSIGKIISALINLLCVASVVYFGFILPMNKAEKFTKPDDTGAQTNKLLKEILEELKNE